MRVISFNEKFRLYLETLNTVRANVFVCGDFNLWMDDPSDHNANDFLEIMES